MKVSFPRVLGITIAALSCSGDAGTDLVSGRLILERVVEWPIAGTVRIIGIEALSNGEALAWSVDRQVFLLRHVEGAPTPLPVEGVPVRFSSPEEASDRFAVVTTSGRLQELNLADMSTTDLGDCSVLRTASEIARQGPLFAALNDRDGDGVENLELVAFRGGRCLVLDIGPVTGAPGESHMSQVKGQLLIGFSDPHRPPWLLFLSNGTDQLAMKEVTLGPVNGGGTEGSAVVGEPRWADLALLDIGRGLLRVAGDIRSDQRILAVHNYDGSAYRTVNYKGRLGFATADTRTSTLYGMVDDAEMRALVAYRWSWRDEVEAGR